MILYTFELKYWLNYHINLYEDFFDKIQSSYNYFHQIQVIYELIIIEIISFYKIIKKINYE